MCLNQSVTYVADQAKPTAKSQEPRAAKIAIRVLVLVLLGAVVNVAVAWGCAMALHPMSSRQFSAGKIQRDDGRVLQYQLRRNVGVLRAQCEVFRPRPWDEPVPVSATPVPEWMFRLANDVCGIDSASVIEVRGWPFLSLWCELDIYNGDWAGPWHHRADGDPGVELKMHPVGDTTVFPLRPLWPGFLINTTLYAGVLWLLLLGPFAARRMIRRRRGRCPQCGYDLRGELAEGCSECGWGRAPGSGDRDSGFGEATA